MVEVHRLLPSEHDDWRRMRMALWPDLRADECAREAVEMLADPSQAIFIAAGDRGLPVGFVEASIKDWAQGCTTRPIGYIEGWYVAPEVRMRGIGRALIAAAEDWARSHGCREMASDTDLDNVASQIAHGHLNYDEVERNVHFRKDL